MGRHNLFATSKTNNIRVGENILANRLSVLNGQISLDRLNESYSSYKVKCKMKFLS